MRVVAKNRPFSPTKVPMPEQDPQVRGSNFGEVALGYTAEQARQEAGRCLGCKKPACVEACPVNVDIPTVIGLAAEGRFAEAARGPKDQRLAGHLWPRLPPGNPVRSPLCPGQEVRVGRHWPAGALRGGLHAGMQPERTA